MRLMVILTLILVLGAGPVFAFDGVIVPFKEISVTSKVSAFAKSIKVNDGELVKEKAVICEFDDAAIQQDLTKAELELEKIKLENKKLKQGKSDEEIEKLNISLKILEMKHRMLKDELEANQKIYETEGISKKELENTKNDLEVSRFNIEGARLDLKVAEEYPPSIDIQISDQNKAIKEYNVKSIKDTLKYTVITSETSRFIKEIMINEGDYVTEGKPIALLLDISRVYAEINVTVSKVPDYQVGRKVKVVVSLLKKTFDGTVTASFPQIDSATGTVKTRILIDNPDGKIRPGMLVKVE